MWDLLSKLIPVPVIAGILIWGLVCTIFLQPVIEQRRADISYIPMCKSGKLPVTKLSGSQQPEGEVSASIEKPLGLQIASELRGLLRDEDERTYAAIRYSGEDSCSCAVNVAYERHFWSSLSNIMLLGFYTPRTIAHFEVAVSKVKSSGICG